MRWGQTVGDINFPHVMGTRPHHNIEERCLEEPAVGLYVTGLGGDALAATPCATRQMCPVNEEPPARLSIDDFKLRPAPARASEPFAHS